MTSFMHIWIPFKLRHAVTQLTVSVSDIAVESAGSENDSILCCCRMPFSLSCLVCAVKYVCPFLFLSFLFSLT